MWMHAGRAPRLLAVVAHLIFVCATAAALTKTPIRDVLYNADGSKVSGTVTVEWQAFTAADGSTIAANKISARIVHGVLSLDLTPNENASPAGTTYRVSYHLGNGFRSAEVWLVPQNSSPVTVSQVRVSPPPPQESTISQSQVTGLVQELDSKADLAEPNIFTAPQVTREESASSTNPLLSLEKSDGSHSIGFDLPGLTSSTVYTLPVSDGALGQHLSTDGAGNLFWASSDTGASSGSAYEFFQNDGVSVTQRNVANFSNGLQVFDNEGQTRTEVQPVYGTSAGTVTEGNDARLSDARDPLPHAATHASSGSDPVTPASIGALKNTNDKMISSSLDTAVLSIRGLSGQSAALTEWRDGDNQLLSLVTPAGSAFFREMGIAAPPGGNVVSQFFQQDGKNRFAFTVFPGVFRMLRYDDAGAFRDNAFEIFRNGSTLWNTAITINDPAIGPAKLLLNGNYSEYDEAAAPGTPAGNKARLFLDASSGEITVRKDDGTLVSLEQGGGGGEGSFSVFRDAETPLGAIDGTNDTFTLQEAPNPAASLTLARNGVVQKPGVDFLLSGDTITFEPEAIPQTGDELIAWYRTNASNASGDLSGVYPNPQVVGMHGRAISAAAPADGQCLVWSEAEAQWTLADCAVVTDSLQWHFSGAASTGVKPMILVAPEGLAGASLTNSRIVANSPGSATSTLNIERCTSGCSGTAPSFSPIYTSDVSLPADTRTVTGGLPDSDIINAGDQFRINLTSVASGVADVTVSLTFQYPASH